MTAPLARLPTRWMERADGLATYAPGVATAIRDCANELTLALAEARDEPLTLPQAAKESGYSTDHLAKLVRAGQVPNAGRKHAPRIKRGDLPRKAAVVSRGPELQFERVRSAIRGSRCRLAPSSPRLAATGTP